MQKLMAVKVPSLVSDGKAALEAACRGFVAVHPQLLHHETQRVLYRSANDNHHRVTILSGGGSGHEPAHAGYVGKGMLDAAVCGTVFASPNALQIETGLKLVESPKGILVIVKNYTGDKLNFSLAAERFKFSTGTPVRLIVVGDDVSIGRTRAALVGRRGLAGTILVHKIAGAAAADGLSLDELADAADFILGNMGTIGVGLDSCDLPGQPHQSRLQPDEIEVGIGIHNEPGARKVRPQPSLPSLIRDVLSGLLDRNDSERNYISTLPHEQDSDVVLMVNNLGGLSNLELHAVVAEVVAELQNAYRVRPSRVYAGTFLSALNGPGFSVTILSLPKTASISSSVLKWLDAPTDAPGWTCSIAPTAWTDFAETRDTTNGDPNSQDHSSTSYDIPNILCDPSLFRRIITSAHSALTAAEPEITRMDTIMGDGDCGTTLLEGASSLVAALDQEIVPSSLSNGMMSVANVLSRTMGGTSGALYAVFFTAFASAICDAGKYNPSAVGFSTLVQCLETALRKLEQVTAARVGDRTMMDAIIPAISTLAARHADNPSIAIDEAVKAAISGCEGTKTLISKFGRSTYVSAEGEDDAAKNLPDPGACGVVAILTGIRDALSKQKTI